jgi:hypothetical protein
MKSVATIFDLLSTRFGKTPVVIDSDDLLENPAAMVEKYCNAIGIPFGADSVGLRYDFHDAFAQDQLRKFTQNLTNHRIILPDLCHFPE